MNRLAHVCIETDDLEKTEAFYDLLGLKRRFEFRNKRNELVGFYLAFNDDSYIEVIYVAEVRKEGAVRHFAIEAANVELQHEQLRQSGIEVGEIFNGGDHTRMFTCHDPNGIFIEVMQYTEDSMQHRGGVCEVDYNPHDT